MSLEVNSDVLPPSRSNSLKSKNKHQNEVMEKHGSEKVVVINEEPEIRKTEVNFVTVSFTDEKKIELEDGEKDQELIEGNEEKELLKESHEERKKEDEGGEVKHEMNLKEMHEERQVEEEEEEEEEEVEEEVKKEKGKEEEIVDEEKRSIEVEEEEEEEDEEVEKESDEGEEEEDVLEVKMVDSGVEQSEGVEGKGEEEGVDASERLVSVHSEVASSFGEEPSEIDKSKVEVSGKSNRMTKEEVEEWVKSLATWQFVDFTSVHKKEDEEEEEEDEEEDDEEEEDEEDEENESNALEQALKSDYTDPTLRFQLDPRTRLQSRKEVSLERLKLEHEFFTLHERMDTVQSRHLRLQNQVAQLLCKTDRELTEYTCDNDTQQQKDLYVKLFTKYLKLSKAWEKMEDMEKEEVDKWNLLKSQVKEEMDALIEKKLGALLGKNRNEKSPKFQLAVRLEEAERKKWIEANMLQTNNFLFKMQLEELKKQLKERENIGSNYTITGYNQLKHENITSKDQILQKNEQIEVVLKNTKVTSQKMSHIKEKLNFVTKQHNCKMAYLMEKEKRCDQLYRDLNLAKHAKMKARHLLANLQSKSDLLSYPELLMDYEFGLEKTANMNKELAQLKAAYDDKLQYLAVLKKNLSSRAKD